MTDVRLEPKDFVHLHNHTHYSLLDGLQKVPAMVERVSELGMKAVAVTDHGTLSGAIQFYKEAKNRDINPIIGIETYVAPRKHTDKEGKQDANPYHLILLAMNNIGYQNLMKLSSIAQLDGFYYKPRIDHDLLKQYNEGLICLSGCVGGEVGDALRNKQYEQAKKTAKWYKQIFGDRYYLELQDHHHEWPVQKEVNDQLLKLSKEIEVPAVITADAHYLNHEDQDAHEILLCVQTGSLLEDTNRMSLTETSLHLTDPEEIIERWKEYPNLVINTRKIADRCKVEIQLGEILIPEFPLPKGENESDYLEREMYRGLVWRYKNKTKNEVEKYGVEESKALLDKVQIERAEYELGVIREMGFEGYFLIVSDFVNWGKDKGIVFGPGRGSAAGSIIAYALGITNLDPLHYDLLFERFLNPDRISMPDIDIDIQDTRRDEVIDYVSQKYGEDRVANIVTFGTMAARNAIRDVARVLNVPYGEADRLAKMVPAPIQGRHIPLEVSIKDDKELRNEYATNPQSKRVIDLAVRLEGTIRSHGVHAAGVVIAPDEITKFTPLERSSKGPIATQYSMNPIEDIGLLKMDFLGLSNLTTIKNALRIIKKVYKRDIDIDDIDLDDKKTFELLSRGDTTGVFQLESAGMKRYIKDLKPDTFEDIIAMVALYRPGPMQFIEEFINRKHGRSEVTYMHEKMEGSLENTYGILVYQEQVMEIAKNMCGFSGGQADTLRKAIGKKIASMMAEMKTEFIEGGVKHSGVDHAMMEQFWQQLEEFAAYCFNKSHAACYAMIAYQTAYLKAHFPSAFMAALMSSDYGDTDRIAIEISEARHMNIKVLPPDVNESFVEFAVRPDDGAIRYGMSAIKNVGTSAVEAILETRDADGKFISVADFARRVSTRSANKKVWESLIKSGAFDEFGDSRATLLQNLDTILAFGSKSQKAAASGQTDLFGGALKEEMAPRLNLEPATEPATERERLSWEKELLGVYLSQHPLESYKDILSETTVPIEDIEAGHENKSVTVGGTISVAREIVTKKGDKMAFATIEDTTDDIELIVFPRAYADFGELINGDGVLKVTGKVNSRDRDGKLSNDPKIMVDEVKEITFDQAKNYNKIGKVKKLAQAKTLKVEKKTVTQVDSEPSQQTQAPHKLNINIDDAKDAELLSKLHKVLTLHPGEDIVMINISDVSKQKIQLPIRVDVNSSVADELIDLLGSKEAVSIT